VTGLRDRLRGLAGRFRQRADTAPAPDERGGSVASSLRGLLDDPTIPPAVRETMAADFRRVETMLDRLERGNMALGSTGLAVGRCGSTRSAGDECMHVCWCWRCTQLRNGNDLHFLLVSRSGVDI
jgi:hypothetical protein